MTELIRVLRSGLRVSAAFFTLAVLGTVIGYFLFHLPLADLPIAIVVPILWMFAISRVLVLTLPASKGDPAPVKSASNIIGLSVIVAFLSGIASIDFLLSAGTFLHLQPRSLAFSFLKLAEICGIIFTVIVLSLSAFVVRKLVSSRADALIEGIWRILRWPARLADSLLRMVDSLLRMPKISH
jgi:hypothetical protein